MRELTLRQRLQHETAAAHGRLEKQLGLLDPSLDIHRYRAVLETFYGFYVPVEVALTRVAAATPPVGFSLRSRAELIARDLFALGLQAADVAALPRCPDVPLLSCLEDLAGCLYVLEGACLGGQFLAPRLHERLGIAKDRGASFFAGDEERTYARWSVVLAWLGRLPNEGASTTKIIAAAQATFERFAQWAKDAHAQEVRDGRCERL